MQHNLVHCQGLLARSSYVNRRHGALQDPTAQGQQFRPVALYPTVKPLGQGNCSSAWAVPMHARKQASTAESQSSTHTSNAKLKVTLACGNHQRHQAPYHWV
jgi:hypothetical protein